MHPIKKELYEFDRAYNAKWGRRVVGVDEVGRAPLAGPVVAAAVMFFSSAPQLPVDDSKKLSPKKREILFFEILKHSLHGIGIAVREEIDAINIYHASRLAMKRAVLALTRTPRFMLIDGNAKIDLPLAQESIIKGDGASASIAAASIVAKVYRDCLMRQMHLKYPNYLFHQHKGYPTPVHLEKLKAFGPCHIHRRSFSPVKAALSQNKETYEISSC